MQKQLTLSLRRIFIFLIFLTTAHPFSLAAKEQQDQSVITMDETLQSPLTTKTESGKTDTADQLNALFATWRLELDLMQAALQHLSQLIAMKKITPSNPYEAFEWLQNVTTVIGKIKKLPYAPLTTDKLVQFFTINKSVAKVITIALDSGLEIQPDLEQFKKTVDKLLAIKWPEENTLPIEAATSYAYETEKIVGKLLNRANKSGLTWFNRLYTRLSNINHRFAIGKTLFTAGVGSVAGLGVLCLLPDTLFNETNTIFNKNNILGKLKQKVGYYDAGNSYNYQRTMSIQASIGIAASVYAGAQALGLTEGIYKVFVELDAILRGTTPDLKKEINFINDITLADPRFDCVRHLFKPFDNILEFFRDPQKYVYSGMKIPRCVLLIGTPGSGKTLAAKALAGSINELFFELGRFEQFGFIEVEPWDMVDIDSIIKRAKENSPCVIFIDELHLFGGGAQINSNAMGLSKLLTEIDKIDQSNDPSSQIFVVAATNRPDLLAKALLRHGRFGTRIEFPIPSRTQRKSVLETLCKKSAVDTTDIDLDLLAALTEGHSFSALNKLFEHAAFLAKERAEGITHEHLYEALNYVIRGLGQKIDLNDEEKNVIAAHLAGVALTYLEFDPPTKLESMTLRAPARNIVEQYDFVAKMENTNTDAQHVARYGTYYTWNPNEYIRDAGYPDSIVQCKILLAGQVAQKVLLGQSTAYNSSEITSGKHDRQLAFETARSIVENNIKIDDLSKDKQNELKDKALALVESCEKELTELFEKKKDSLKKIAHALKEKNFLKIDQIKRLVIDEA